MVLARVSLDLDSETAARVMMVVEDVAREVRELEEGMMEVLILRKGDW